VGNLIRNNFYGIFKAGPVTITGIHSNLFFSVTHAVGSVAGYGG
jgi:hypothetical protein